ncbi:MAG: tryptophan-rich sensory protein [Syntrophaceae bacterium]|nr:tryptophan-rich sensory protein [Syntrophaceae bacterium]
MLKGKGTDISRLIIAVLVCQAAGLIGAFFTRPAISTWYAELIKPRFTPPDWVFGPVWISLYILMGIAAFLVWSRGFHHQVVRRALAIFGVQLGLNALWSFLFFGLRSPLAGLIGISVLGIAIIFTVRSFLQVSRTAGLLLIPYFLWVSFASGLNLSIWWLNC